LSGDAADALHRAGLQLFFLFVHDNGDFIHRRALPGEDFQHFERFIRKPVRALARMSDGMHSIENRLADFVGVILRRRLEMTDEDDHSRARFLERVDFPVDAASGLARQGHVEMVQHPPKRPYGD
jgi:hypothetical protein